MIRTCYRCKALHDPDSAEDDRYWLCARCWIDGWRVGLVGNLIRPKERR